MLVYIIATLIILLICISNLDFSYRDCGVWNIASGIVAVIAIQIVWIFYLAMA